MGFPWFWPARPPGQHAMVEARRMVRWHFGRDHDPVRRKLAQVLVTVAWPLGVLLNLWVARRWLGPGSRQASEFQERSGPRSDTTFCRASITPMGFGNRIAE